MSKARNLSRNTGFRAPFNGVPVWRQGLTNFVWKKLTGTNITGYSTTNGGTVGTNIMDAYSGWFWDPIRLCIVIFGGGHNDYSGNEVIGFRLYRDAPDFITICEPTPTADRVTSVVWQGTAPNQKLSSCHTYDSGITSVLLDRYIWLQQASPWGSAGGISGGNRMFSMERSTGTWIQPASDLGVCPGFGKAVCIDASGRIYTTAQDGMYRYEVGSGWTEYVHSSSLHTSGLCALVADDANDQVLRLSCDEIKILTVGNTSPFTITDRTSSLTGTGSVVTDLLNLIALDSPGVCLDTDNNEYILPTGNGSEIITVGAATWACAKTTPTVAGGGAIPNGAKYPGGGVFGKAKFIPEYHGMLYCPAGTSDFYFYPTATM